MTTKKWLSIHIFYASNANPMLLEALEPLVIDLRKRGMIRRYFFIRYFQEGPHIRLRLLVEEGVAEEDVKREAENVINGYLKRRPALYSAENDKAQSFYKDMYITEYGVEKWNEVYGALGKMPIRPNNSMHYIDYEPEYGRYGGSDGIEVAEWHFEKSSEIVMELIRSTNLHVRSILLGLSIQLALPLCFGLLEDEQRVVQFLANYGKYWMDNYGRPKEGADLTANFEKKYARVAPNLLRRLTEIQSYVIQNKVGALTLVEREWIAHIRELKERLDDLVADRKLVFQGRTTQGEAYIPDQPAVACSILLTSYLHMTNNRLGVSITDEIYLAYLMMRALEEQQQASQVENTLSFQEVAP
ncbi:MAG TPA: lantibiotic dehydratase C-terminal domain-containing protein [Ktedonobacteraceae bacterium]|nr:lantibiotic dehydratase C-terminal domain-containing protein [Ktedonobacteraceae bacterium]